MEKNSVWRDEEKLDEERERERTGVCVCENVNEITHTSKHFCTN